MPEPSVQHFSIGASAFNPVEIFGAESARNKTTADSADDQKESEPDPPKITYTDDEKVTPTKQVRRRCSNCATTTSRSWRRSVKKPGKVVCNKCGLYERTLSFPHPLRHASSSRTSKHTIADKINRKVDNYHPGPSRRWKERQFSSTVDPGPYALMPPGHPHAVPEDTTAESIDQHAQSTVSPFNQVSLSRGMFEHFSGHAEGVSTSDMMGTRETQMPTAFDGLTDIASTMKMPSGPDTEQQ